MLASLHDEIYETLIDVVRTARRARKVYQPMLGHITTTGNGTLQRLSLLTSHHQKL